jgi:hypothetical protein
MGKETGLGVQFVNCFGHNVRGLSDEKLEEVVEHMKVRRIWVYVMQETWRVGDFQQESGGFLFINHGFPERRCNRGSGVVGFVRPRLCQWHLRRAVSLPYGVSRSTPGWVCKRSGWGGCRTRRST